MPKMNNIWMNTLQNRIKCFINLLDAKSILITRIIDEMKSHTILEFIMAYKVIRDRDFFSREDMHRMSTSSQFSTNRLAVNF